MAPVLSTTPVRSGYTYRVEPSRRVEEGIAVAEARTDEEIRACHAVMRELRPRYGADEFVAQVRRQQAEGYRLAVVRERGEVMAVAGFRIAESLAWGKYLYVDDLVTAQARRSAGHGARLMAWLRDEARREGCVELHLDSGVQRHDAHRFYLRERMAILSHHFSQPIEPERR